MSYNQGSYKDLQNTTSDYTIYRSSSDTVYDKSTRTNAGTVTHSGTNTFSGTNNVSAAWNLTTGGYIKSTVEALTTATTGTAIPKTAFVTVKSTKTADTFTMYNWTAGEEVTIHCVNASATGYVRISVDTSAGAAARTVDGSNYLLDFKKAGESVKLFFATTTRVIEIARSVADGTALTSTST